jgi:ATP-dependent Clp protease ATP-binding subunit ClpA
MRFAQTSVVGPAAEEAQVDPPWPDTKLWRERAVPSRVPVSGQQRQSGDRAGLFPAVGSGTLRKWDVLTSGNLSIETQENFEQAAQLAFRRGQNQLYPEHLFVVLLTGRSQKTRRIIADGGADLVEVQARLEQRIESLGHTKTEDNAIGLSRSMRQVVSAGSRIAQRFAQTKVSPDILVLAFVNAMGSEINIETHRMQAILEKRNVVLQVKEKIKSYVANDQYEKSYRPCALRRIIPKCVRDNIVSDILANLINDGDTFVIDAGENSMLLTAVSKCTLEAASA